MRKRFGWFVCGLVFAGGVPVAWSAVANTSLSELTNKLVGAANALDDLATQGVADQYTSELRSIYGEVELQQEYVGDLKLPDTFQVGITVNQQTQSNPYNLGPFAPRPLMRQLLGHESNRLLARATQVRRVSIDGQKSIHAGDEELRTQLTSTANQAVSLAGAAEAATSTQDAVKLLNQQLALLNAGSTAGAIGALKSQGDLIGHLGNLQLLVADVGEALDLHRREQYYGRSQQLLTTAVGAFSAAENLAWQTTTVSEQGQ